MCGGENDVSGFSTTDPQASPGQNPNRVVTVICDEVFDTPKATLSDWAATDSDFSKLPNGIETFERLVSVTILHEVSKVVTLIGNPFTWVN
jgi:hypothetical protein